MIEVARSIGSNRAVPPKDHSDTGVQAPWGRDIGVDSIDNLVCKYYLRLTVTDQPGVLAQIASILGDGNISIASVLQKDTDPQKQTAEIVITTHPALEASMQTALRQVASLEVVQEVNNMLRIEE